MGSPVRRAAGKELEVTLLFGKEGEPLAPTAKIGGVEQPAYREARFRLKSGTYNVELGWKDRLGNSYRHEQEIEVSEPGLADVFVNQQGSLPSAPPCLLSSAIGLAILLFVINRKGDL